MYTKKEIRKICLNIIADKIGIDSIYLFTYMNKSAFANQAGLKKQDVDEICREFGEKLGIKISNTDIEELKNCSLEQILDKVNKIYTERVPATKIGNQFTGMRTNKDCIAYCKLLGEVCKMPAKTNNTDAPYCEFVNCKLYKNFQKLR